MVELESLIEAARSGDVTKVRALIAGHPALVVQRLPSGESALMAALYRGQHQMVATLVELGAEIDVFAAAATGNLAALREALQQPGALDAYAYDGWTPLHLAAFFGQREAARLLLDAGANVHAVSRNSLANTPLHAATAGKHGEIALMLIDRGADAELPDGGGFSARTIASENQLPEVLNAMDSRRLRTPEDKAAGSERSTSTGLS